MALGKRKGNVSGSFLPLVKFDARVGSFYLLDREQSVETGDWETKQRDITDEFRAVFDLQNLEVGWIRFPKGQAPEARLVPAGQDPGEAPGDDWRQGLRLVMAVVMPPALGDDIRELMSTARALWVGIDALHDGRASRRYSISGYALGTRSLRPC